VPTVSPFRTATGGRALTPLTAAAVQRKLAGLQSVSGTCGGRMEMRPGRQDCYPPGGTLKGSKTSGFTPSSQRLHPPCASPRCPRRERPGTTNTGEGGEVDRRRSARAGSVADIRSGARGNRLPPAEPPRHLPPAPPSQPMTSRPGWAWGGSGVARSVVCWPMEPARKPAHRTRSTSVPLLGKLDRRALS